MVGVDGTSPPGFIRTTIQLKTSNCLRSSLNLPTVSSESSDPSYSYLFFPSRPIPTNEEFSLAAAGKQNS